MIDMVTERQEQIESLCKQCHVESLASRYFQLLHALEELFERNVDLIEIDAVENPYVLNGIQSTRQVLYAA